MRVKVLFFASLRELTGKAEAEFDSEQETADLAAIWAQASGNKPMPEHTLCAINMEYARIDDVAADDDEVAFFPPVTGG